MIKRIIATIIIVSMVFSAGCWNIVELNEAAVAIGLGADVEDDDVLSFTAQLAFPIDREAAGPGEETHIVVTEKGDTFTEAARKIMLTVPRLPIWAHSSTFLIGENLAKKDLALIADFIGRNRNIRKNSAMFLTRDTTPAEVYEVETPLEMHSAVALMKMIQIQEEQLGIYIPVTISEFLAQLSTPGIEPVLPQVVVKEVDEEKHALDVEDDDNDNNNENGEEEEEEEEEEIEKSLRLDGTGVFAGRKLVGSLNEIESRGLRFLQTRMINGGLITLEDVADINGRITLELIRSRAIIKPQIEGETITMDIDIEGEFNFYELSGSTKEILNRKYVGIIEEATARKVEQEVSMAINRAQELESDIFGFGREISRVNPNSWKELNENWNTKHFPEVETNIKVTMDLRRSYLQDKIFRFAN
ncbi:hypothetical protein SYNTR_1939 [Candidatus Syntrophocurvum alkaliphilum]|uniref:Spore germination protein GerKC n=1 Tax=Candidatus Syntrophocurvum alkaliphilum TaxID=2293317 RepID=A0A6I6DHG8_9FIRM|nr:Ger(x)C family spore germination protein [Candidatus Syntrophocurvum alkaliphilum]QGU00533.1 hypothetical protein SYNTR_1939 [Candidatus Syntrophocurvum alkaliphilum]